MEEDSLNQDQLLTYPNPKQTSVTESPESTLSSDSSSLVNKKTRDLPNLSDCHSCGIRINHTNPRDRLQPLDSLWRIVLLCKKCIKRVNSSDICPYCFLDIVDNNDSFNCLHCHHSVHKDCVERFGSGFEFTVCVDCWVPDAMAKSIRKRKSRFRKRNDRSSEKVVREMKRKVVVAVRARDFDLKKAKDVSLKKDGSVKVVKGGEVKVVNDAELAFLLHRAINSSARISRYSYRKDDVPMVCYSRRGGAKKVDLMGSSGLDVPLICYSRRYGKGLSSGLVSLDAPLMCYSRRRTGCKACCSRDVECACYVCKGSNDGSTSSAGLKACDPDSSVENSLSGNSCQENDVGRQSLRYLLKYYRVGKGKPRPSVFAEAPGCCSCMVSANLYTEGMLDTRNYGNGNGNECLEISKNCDDNTDRFLLKYKRSLR